MKEKKPKVGAAWKEKTRNDLDYVSVLISEDVPAGSHLAMWVNGFKENSKQPDFVLYLDKR